MRWLRGSGESKKASRTSRPSHSTQHTSNGGSSLKYQIQEIINGLPKDLKKKSNSRGETISPQDLCDVHCSLNHYLVDDIFRLVKREVTSHFRQLDAYPDLIEPAEAEILHNLRALKGLWTKPSLDESIPLNAWLYQINECAACILARIASDQDTLRNLRVVIQSRTRTRKNHRPRELNIFVDHCINRLTPAEAEDLHSTSSQLAFGMKRARKACVKAYMRDREDDTEQRSRRKRRHHHNRRKDRAKSHRTPSITFTSTSEENLAITPSLIPHPLIMYNLQDTVSSPSSESWDDCDDNRRRRPEAPSPETPRFKRITQQPSHPGSKVIFSEVEWGNFAQQSEKVTMYQNHAGKNPYARATLVPEAMVDASGVDKSRRYSESTLALFRPVAGLDCGSVKPEDGMISDSVSVWTDAECEVLDCNPGLIRNASVGTDTTWSLVCGHYNLV